MLVVARFGFGSTALRHDPVAVMSTAYHGLVGRARNCTWARARLSLGETQASSRMKRSATTHATAWCSTARPLGFVGAGMAVALLVASNIKRTVVRMVPPGAQCPSRETRQAGRDRLIPPTDGLLQHDHKRRALE